MDRVPEHFAFGVPAGFDVTDCADNPYNDWIGAQIRADLYGWVCPGRPALAAKLARQATAELARLDVRLPGATSEESDAQQGRAQCDESPFVCARNLNGGGAGRAAGFRDFEA